ncbi:glycoside hydrolase family 32 protein [Saccharibacter sp. 17.LH.SD]|nr:glycoside hydrolase family 32 protein [Saccharibacter sp. 17.LH.SD]
MSKMEKDDFYERLYRPHIHFSPSVGFINDPCGLVYDGKLYHLYYQFRPMHNLLNEVDWGHAVSPDLYQWEDREHAIVNSDEKGMAFTGSVVMDRQNISSLFPSGKSPASPDKMAGGLVALYTRDNRSIRKDHTSVIHAAWSGDDGDHYEDFAHNPVLDLKDPDTRDPQVFWHEPTKMWVLVLASAYKHQVLFYGSTDLIKWELLSVFGPAGDLGVEFECPNLVELEIEGEKTKKWVLFISLNPGSPQGGSSTQYFVGSFDGRTFTPDNSVMGFTDFAKDSYAVQIFNDAPDGLKCGISWFGNWQYCFFQPPKNWTGVMTLPREFHLRRNEIGLPILIQRPIGIDSLISTVLVSSQFHTEYEKKSEQSLSIPTDAAIDVRLAVDVMYSVEPNGWFEIEFSNKEGEILSLGYQRQTKSFWIDRGGLEGFSNHTFTDKFAASLPRDSKGVEVQIILDGCTLEVYLNDGAGVGTCLIFPKQPLDRLTLRSSQLALDVKKFQVHALKTTVKGREFL